MVIRNIIRQLETPDRLRGRMTGVNMVFFMGGPQLGELEAGAVANWLGAPFSVISGGIGCLIATGWVAGADAGAAALPAARTAADADGLHGWHERRTQVRVHDSDVRLPTLQLSRSVSVRVSFLVLCDPVPCLRYRSRRSTTTK